MSIFGLQYMKMCLWIYFCPNVILIKLGKFSYKSKTFVSGIAKLVFILITRQCSFVSTLHHHTLIHLCNVTTYKLEFTQVSTIFRRTMTMFIYFSITCQLTTIGSIVKTSSISAYDYF